MNKTIKKIPYKNKVIRFIGISFLSASFISLPSHANTMIENNCIQMHVIKNAPIGYIDNENHEMGVHWEYLEVIAKESQLCIEKKLFPYPRIWKSLTIGAHDGGIIFRSPDRDHLIYPVEKIRTLKTVVIPKKGVTINNYTDLKKIIIAKTRGTKLGDRFDKDKSLKVVALNNYDKALLMLKNGRVDAIAGSSVVLSYQLNKTGVIELVDKTQKLVLGEREQWMQLSLQSNYLAHSQKIKKAINTLKANGTFDKIMIKYYGENWQAFN